MTSLPPQRGRQLPSRHAWIKWSTIALPLLCLLIFGTVIGTRLFDNATSADAASFASINGEVPSLVKTSTLVGATDTNQALSLSIALKLRNADNLKAYVDSMSHAKSLTAHQQLTQTELASGYAPEASSQQAVISYMEGYGFTVTDTSKLHLLIGFKGTVGDAENAFHIQINNYSEIKGKTFYAPSTDPSVPANLAAMIQSVVGLNNAAHLSHSPILKHASISTKGATTTNSDCSTTGGYTPSQLATAYNLNSFYTAGLHGEGQTVALYELDDYQQSDISNYTSCFGGGSVPIKKILVDGGPGQPGQGAIEVELDMELVLSAAPNLSALDVYEAPNQTVNDLLDLWQKIISDDSASVISTSWGACEQAFAPADLQTENYLFTVAAAQGQTVFAASGDSGTNDCGFAVPNANAFQAVDDPAAQPYVTGVGGTTLNLNGDNSYSSESVWNDGYDYYPNSSFVPAGGGGVSAMWGRPSWQTGPGVTSAKGREVPDVSLDADPNTGYAMYCTVAVAGCNGWFDIGGTSAAAPMWAAFMALTNEKTTQDHGFNIGFINAYLYQIDQNASGTSYSNDFHDITTGNNDGLDDGKNVYSATANYDMASGLGSYNAWNLANDLEKLAKSPTAPANTTWYLAEGSVGNSFIEFITILNPSSKAAADVSIQYLFPGKNPVTVPHVVNPSTRYTVTVNKDLNIPATASQVSVSAIVTSTNGTPVIVERPMYFNYIGVNSGTDVIGATNTTNTTFYFAQGDESQTSSDTSHEFISIMNPDKSATANVTATFYSNGNVVASQSTSVPPLQRGTIVPSYKGEAAIKVVSTSGVVVERPIYVTANIPTAGGKTTGAASVVGATSTGNDWLFAEGHVGTDFQENLVLANFSKSQVTATVKLEHTNNQVQTYTVQINGQSQATFNVNQAYNSCNTGSNPCSGDISAEVTEPTGSIVAERVMYFHFNGESGETDVVGQAGPASQTIYSFAEGNAIGSFHEYITLQNPTASVATVAIRLFFNGTVIEQVMNLPAYSRTTVDVNSLIDPIVKAYAPHDAEVSAVVQSFNAPIVVERPLYFTLSPGYPYANDTGATDVIGYTGN